MAPLKIGSSGFRMVNPGNVISAYGLGDCTAEARRARSKKFLIKKYSELCELGVSVVNIPSHETRQNLKIWGGVAASHFKQNPSIPSFQHGALESRLTWMSLEASLPT
jgi:hypothetical protein